LPPFGRQVVEGADVIVHVLDARDPMGTKSLAIEEMVLSRSDKRLVFVLNKADLVPRDVLTGWLGYLRRSTPAVPFKSNTQVQKENLGRAKGKVTQQDEGALRTNQAVGAEELIGLLKNYARVGDSKSVITVGIVGFPNVGKSSLINSLMRSRAVAVSSVPGFTKVNHEVILDKNIRLIDSPGIVFADGDSSATALRNCVNVEEMVDVLTPIQAILERCPQAYLMQLYTIPKFKSTDCMGFLALVAKNTGKLKKGGIPNTDAAARTVIHDWNTGKIKYYCRPPAAVSGGGVGEADSKVLSGFSAEMDLSALKDEDMRVLDALDALAATTGVGHVAMDAVASSVDMATTDAGAPEGRTRSASSSSRGSVAMDDDEDDEEDADEDEDDDGEDASTAPGTRSTGRKADDDTQSVTSRRSSTKPAKAAALGRPPKSKKLTVGVQDAAELPPVSMRKQQQKQKKKVVKASRRDGRGTDGKSESYSFDTDFGYD
jgi:nuclear GTP-binding protein